MSVPKVIVVLLAFAAYSSGVVLVRGIRGIRGASDANPAECLLVIVALILLVVLWPAGSALLPAALLTLCFSLFGACVGFLLRVGAGSAGTREFEEHEYGGGNSSAWKRWTSFGRAVADHEVRLLVIASYLVFVAPLAMAFQRRDKKPAGCKSGWIARNEIPATIDAARRTY